MILKLDDIQADEDMNCRGYIDTFSVRELADLIKTEGQHQPVLVCNRQDYRKINNLPPDAGPAWYLVAGFRRYKACRQIQDTVLAMEIPAVSLRDTQIINLNENLARLELNLLQEARAVQRLVDQGVADNWIAAKLRKPREWVKARVKLMDSPDYIQEAAAAGHINTTHIRRLYTLKDDRDAQEQLFRRFLDHKENALVKPIKREGTERKKRRGDKETAYMLEYLIQNVGPCLATRCLAWVLGNISDADILADLQRINPQIKPLEVSLITQRELEKAKKEGRGDV